MHMIVNNVTYVVSMETVDRLLGYDQEVAVTFQH